MTTVWLIVFVLNAADGSRHYELGDTPYPTSSHCFEVSEAASRQLQESGRGWAMCLPKDVAERVKARQGLS